MKSNKVQFEATAVVGLKHPCVAGHFPGNPVVPAVVILETAWQVAQPYLQNRVLQEVVQAKFSSVLRPGKEFKIQFELASDDLLKFVCIEEGIHFATGGFRITKNLTEGVGHEPPVVRPN